LYIYVANESPYPEISGGVWFDDLKVEVTKSKVTAVSDYYPFGMLQAGNSTNSGDPTGNKYLYNGNELQVELGLNLYDFKNRFYSQELGRFISVDRLADSPEQFNQSPYQYGWNNPIKFNDPDGDCPACWGAVIGGLVDYGLQVSVNLVEGDDLGTALTDVNVKSIVVSMGAGALSGGLSSVSKLKNAHTLVKAGVEIAVDGTASAANQYVNTGEVNLVDAAIDATAGQLIGKKVSNTVENSAKNSSTGKLLNKAADRKTRIANNRNEIADSGGRARPNQQAKADQANNKFTSYGKTRAMATGVAASNSASTVVKESIKTDEDRSWIIDYTK